MKTYVPAAALVALLAQPAQAITFPSLTTIYVAAGVHDDGAGGSLGTATSVTCSNVSGVATSIRILVLSVGGTILASRTFHNLSHGTSVRYATHPTFLGPEVDLATGAVAGGIANVETTQSAVFCTFAVVDAAGPAAGFPLNAVRVNPHPGTVE